MVFIGSFNSTMCVTSFLKHRHHPQKVVKKVLSEPFCCQNHDTFYLWQQIFLYRQNTLFVSTQAVTTDENGTVFLSMVHTACEAGQNSTVLPTNGALMELTPFGQYHRSLYKKRISS